MTIDFAGPELAAESGPNWSYLMYHHTATPPGTTVEQIRADHLRRGWLDIGYHFLIGPDGKVYPGRPLKMPGAHALGYNTTAIGIAAIGDFNKHEMPAVQRQVLIQHGRELLVNFGIPPGKVLYHGDVAATLCPGKFFPDVKGALLVPFRDVPANHWAREAVTVARDAGILGGYPDGTFRGNESLTRYEVAAVIAKIMERLGK